MSSMILFLVVVYFFYWPASYDIGSQLLLGGHLWLLPVVFLVVAHIGMSVVMYIALMFMLMTSIQEKFTCLEVLTASWHGTLGCCLNSISNVRKVTLTNVSITGLVVHPYKYRLLDCSCKVSSLPGHYDEVVQCEGWPVVDWLPYMAEGASLNLSPNVLAYTPMFSSM